METADLLAYLTVEEQAELDSIVRDDIDAADYTSYQNDAIGYAEHVLKVSWWHKQQEVARKLSVPPYRVLVKACHDVGKCIAASEWITLGDGSRKQAKDLVGSSFTLLTLADGKVVQVLARAEHNAIEPVYALTTDSGRRVVRNAAHPLWVADGVFGSGNRPKITPVGWTPLLDIKPGQLVAATEALSIIESGDDFYTDTQAKVLAYMIGDGAYTQANVRFTQMDGLQLTEFEECVNSLGAWLVKSDNRPYDYRICATRGKPGQNPVINLLRQSGMMGTHSRDKRIPAPIFSATKRQQRVFLSRLYSTDGWAHLATNKARGEIGFCSASEGLIRDIQEILLRFGIRAQVNRKAKANAWTVTVMARNDVIRFIDEIGIYGKEEAVCKVRAYYEIKGGYSKAKWRKKEAIPGTIWERVISVEYAGIEATVAIEVPDYNTFLTLLYEHNTHLAGGLVNWWFDAYPNSITLTTAPTERQVKDLLWKEIRVQRRDRGGFAGPRIPRLEMAPDHFAHGYVAKEADAFQGHHSEHMMFIFDEAVGVAHQFWEATESMFAGEGHAWVCIFNPTDTASQAYLEEMTGKWHVVEMSMLEHPNILAEQQGLRPPYPAAIRMGRVSALVDKWCTPIETHEKKATDIEWPPQSGEWWRPGPVAEARMLGRWPSQATNNVWSDAAWQLATKLVLDQGDNPVEIGCDVGRFGDDNTEMHIRRGPVSLHHEAHNGWGTGQIAARLRELCRIWGAKVNMEPTLVATKVDDTGIGGGVTDQSEGYNFIPINAKNRAIDAEHYPNQRSELWFAVADRANHGNLSLALLSEDTRKELRRQAMTPTWKQLSDGRREVEDKSLTKRRIKRSPDGMDAVNLAYAPVQIFYPRDMEIGSITRQSMWDTPGDRGSSKMHRPSLWDIKGL